MSEIQGDKLKSVLSAIVDRLPASPNESDTAQLRADIAGIDSTDENVTVLDPTTATVENPTGAVTDSAGSSAVESETTTDSETTSDVTSEPAPADTPFQRDAAIADVDAFMANATDEQIAALDAFTKTDQ